LVLARILRTAWVGRNPARKAVVQAAASLAPAGMAVRAILAQVVYQ
jgi:hypothetical protein